MRNTNPSRAQACPKPRHSAENLSDIPAFPAFFAVDKREGKGQHAAIGIYVRASAPVSHGYQK
ncbi:MAG TPA: hypothetical protein VN155_15065 [Devosia sp.]|nr:hypothetical protein [Devosia sp.]